MYSGSNPTAIQSQQWLCHAMTALMTEKSYATISIRDLCQRADLSRQTFYNFFASKEEVLRFCLKETYRIQFEALSQQHNVSLPDMLDAFFSVITENRPLIDSILRDGLTGLLADEILISVSLFLNRFIKPEKKNELFPYSEAMLSGALTQLIVIWTTQSDPLSVTQVNTLLTDFFAGQLYPI